MNSKHHGKCEQGISSKSAIDFFKRSGHQHTAHAGLNQGSLSIIVVHFGHNSFLATKDRSHESESILAAHLAKWRDMKNLAGLQGLTPARAGQQIAMPFTKGVVHLRHNGSQRIVQAMTIPKTNRLEGVAQNARKCLQPNLAKGIDDALFQQQLLQPRQCAAERRGSAITVVDIKKRNDPGRLMARSSCKS